MRTENTAAEGLDRLDHRREQRRHFLRTAGATTLAAGGLGLLSACGGKGSSSPTPTPTGTGTPTPTPTATTSYTDADVYSVALNLNYLKAQFYYQAAFGAGLDAASLTGAGTQGSVTGGKQATLSNALVAQYARELAAANKHHVGFLRTQLASDVIAQPAINIDGGASGAFTAMARMAGLVGSSSSFDPYASDINFLLAAFFFEDLSVTAYKGASPLVAGTALREAMLGLAGEAGYHAAMIRTTLYTMGSTAIADAGKISDLRDSLDGTTDLDQGLTGFGGAVNIVPTDTNGITFSRSLAQVFNILFLNASSVSKGGFFPSGVNGTVNTSAGA